MKVILLQTVDRLGATGEVITVKEGYARNYLIPKNVAQRTEHCTHEAEDVTLQA